MGEEEGMVLTSSSLSLGGKSNGSDVATLQAKGEVEGSTQCDDEKGMRGAMEGRIKERMRPLRSPV
jgi:hypothetical protein